MSIANLIERKIAKWIGMNKKFPIQLDITNLCNLRCAHCYHPNHNNSGAIKLEQWKSILDQYFGLIDDLGGRAEVIFCGGEPLISPYLFPLMEYAHKIHPQTQFTVLTNGTRLQVLKKLSTMKEFNLRYQVSLDGPNEDLHDRVRGKGSFKKTLEGIKVIGSSCRDVNLLATLSKSSVQHIDKFFELAQQLQVNSMSFTRLVPVGHAEKSDSDVTQSLFGGELKRAFEEIIISSSRYNVSTNTDSPLWTLFDSDFGTTPTDFTTGIVVDYQGNFLASSRSRIKLGKINKNNLKEIFLSHPALENVRKGKVQGCGSCKFWTRCGGDRNLAWAISGDYLAKDPGCWLENEHEKNYLNKTTNKRMGGI